MRKKTLEKSFYYWEKAESFIPAGTQTFSKGTTQYVFGVAPIYLDRGKGCYVWDVDGNKYIDYSLALGPVTLGYCYPEVDRAIKEQLRKGITFSLMHPLEVEVSEMLINIIPGAEMVRFGKNGSDATSGAVRLARAYTGRDKIVCCGYHGWQDWYIATTTRNKGIPEEVKKLTLTFEYNNIESLEKNFDENKNEIAAVIMEAVAIEEPSGGFLKQVKEITHKNGALLIFDEIVNGFRIAIGGAGQLYKVIPDLACFGKGMANGMPLSALVGKKEIMKGFEDVFFSFTFGGEVLSLAAAKATIGVFKKENVIEHFYKQGRKLLVGYNNLAEKHGLKSLTGAVGLPAHSAIFFRDLPKYNQTVLKSLFQQEIIKAGILSIGVHNICFSLKDKEVERTLDAYDRALAVLKRALDEDKVLDYLDGRPITPIFKRW